MIAKLREGLSIAHISDAGTPVLSDPGFVLVRSAREAGRARRDESPRAVSQLRERAQEEVEALQLGVAPREAGAQAGSRASRKIGTDAQA